MASPNYTMQTAMGGVPQPAMASSPQGQPVSPSQHAARKPRRVYHNIPGQGNQGMHSPIAQPSYPSTPSPTSSQYAQMSSEFSAMNINQPMPPMPSIQPTQMVQPGQPGQPMQHMQPGQPMQPAPPMQHMQSGHPIQPTPPMQHMQPGQPMQYMQPPMARDVSLIGQPPEIKDLQLPPSAPRLPPNTSATSSPNAQCYTPFNRPTLNAIPFSSSLLKKSKLPLALILEPFQSVDPGAEPPIVEGNVVSRCTRCKTYINPFVRFAQGSMKWQCNMCNMDNDVPQEFDWDIVTQQQADRWSRPELNYGCVDFIASEEYIIRPPQPPTYVFVIDTSIQAVQSGVLNVVVDAILESLDGIPNEIRSKVAVITVDNAVGFYKLDEGDPEMLVVGDLADIYLPRNTDNLLVNLNERRTAVEDLLRKLKETSHPPSGSNCLGPALLAARKLLSSSGGKIVCFQASLPNKGEGNVKPQPENKNLLDSAIMTPSSSFYKTFAMECTKHQVCADMFIFGSQYSDVATLNIIPRFTGGQTHFFPNFVSKNGPNIVDRLKVKEELKKLLAGEIGLEAVMRTRCSPGMLCQEFHGHFTKRGTDVMALPNVPVDQSYCVEIEIEEDLQSPVVFFQTALLYTTFSGERRIRVMNLCLPVTKHLPEVFSNADQVAMARVLCHQAITKAAQDKLGKAREQLTKSTIDIFSAYGREVMGSVAAGAAHLTICKELGLLPLLMLGILKSDTFNDNTNIPIDIRAYTTLLLRSLPMDAWLRLVHPNFYDLRTMSPKVGSIDPDTGRFVMPPTIELSSEKLEGYGCFLLDNGQQLSLWVGKSAIPDLCKDLLGVSDVGEIQSGRIPALPVIDKPISQKTNAILNHLRSDRKVSYYPTIDIIKEDGDPYLRGHFLSRLVSDRQPTGPSAAGGNQQQASSGMSYFQWLGFLRAKCQ